MARSRAQDYAEKQQGILHQAAILFARHGFAGTSISMIAEACGVSKALLYHYYPDKDSVLFDILYAHLEELIEAVEKASIEAKDTKDRLYAISAALLESYRDADAEHQVQISSLRLLPAEKQNVLRQMERKLVDIFADAISSTLPEIGRGPLLKPITMSLFGMLNWHYLWFREGGSLSREDYARLATALIEGGARLASETLGGAKAVSSRRPSTATG